MSPCGKYILSGNQKSGICIWDINSKEKNQIPIEYQYHFGEVNSVDWANSENHFIASSSDDCTVLILG